MLPAQHNLDEIPSIALYVAPVRVYVPPNLYISALRTLHATTFSSAIVTRKWYYITATTRNTARVEPISTRISASGFQTRVSNLKYTRVFTRRRRRVFRDYT